MSVTAITRPAHMDEAEWDARVDLAACYRLFVRYGWTDLINTHLSARVPGYPEHYLINPYGLLFEEITASSLLKVDFDGRVLAGDYPFNDAGHAIHTAIFKARPDVNAVLHTHTRAGMAVAAMQGGLLPITQQANELRDVISYHDYYDVATGSDEECQRLGRDIAKGYAMVMRNHGLLSCGRSMAEAFYYMYTTENACKVQVDVMKSGADIVVPEGEVLDDLAKYGNAPEDVSNSHGARAWPALLRVLDRADPTYRS